MKRIGMRSVSFFVLWSAMLALLAGCSGAPGEELVSSNQALCSAVSVVSNDADYTAVPGATVLWTATPACSGSPEYRFWFKTPSGVWSMVQDWSSSNTYSWNTTGLAVGTWEMQAWVRDTVGNYQAYASSQFVLSSSPACTASSTSVSPASGLQGTTVTFANTATTCTASEFLVYHLPPGGSWAIDSGYAAANSSYVWNTTGAAVGTHQFQFWARAQGSTRAYEAYSGASYTVLASAPCSGASIAFSPVGHTAVGNAVTLTASATGCGSSTFRFFVKPPGGNYSELQPYTSSPTVVWNTTLAAAGQYSFQVWARATGSVQSYEALANDVYTLDASTPTSALSIGGGFAHNCELLASGKVGCWGYNADGEVGDGTTFQKKPLPVAVSGITQGISLSAGYSHTCAAVFGGSVQCWGSNLHGQLGNGTNTDASTPVSVSSLANVTQVGAGNSHSCAVLADGSARCWGYNSQGQLGNGLVGPDSYTPSVVTGLTGATKISAGYYHSCALKTNGSVVCWGLGTSGELGNGTSTSSTSPVAVSGLTNVIAISSSSGNNCALKSDGTVWCWGHNTQYGSLGSGSTAAQPTPVVVPGISTARSVAVGPYHGCAALQDGTAVCWGYNAFGQLGNNSTTDSLSPVPVSNLTNVSTVGVALYTTCATLNDNTASCWGYGVLGSLGNGGVANSSVPVAVTAVP